MKHLRIRAGLTLEDVARRIGKSPAYVSQLERGVNAPPTWSLLRDMAATYECSVDELLGIAESPDVEYLSKSSREILNALRDMSALQVDSLAQITDIFQRLKTEARSAALDEMLETVLQIIGQHAGNESMEEFYRAVNLIRRSGDQSRLILWVSRYLRDNGTNGNEQP